MSRDATYLEMLAVAGAVLAGLAVMIIAVITLF